MPGVELRLQTTLRWPALPALSMTVVQAPPSMRTRNEPRPGPTEPTTATALPLKVVLRLPVASVAEQDGAAVGLLDVLRFQPPLAGRSHCADLESRTERRAAMALLVELLPRPVGGLDAELVVLAGLERHT